MSSSPPKCWAVICLCELFKTSRCYPWTDSWTIQVKKQTGVRNYSAYSQNTSPAACKAKLHPFSRSRQTHSILEVNSLPSSKIYFTDLFLFCFSDKRFIFSLSTQLCLFRIKESKKVQELASDEQHKPKDCNCSLLGTTQPQIIQKHRASVFRVILPLPANSLN